MNKKELHIVYGSVGKEVLSQSQYVNNELSDIIGFYDMLSIGSLFNLDDADCIAHRKSWLEDIFGSYESESWSNLVDDDLIQIRTLVETIDNYKSIYIWLGDDANEKINTARVLHHLQGFKIPVFKANFSKTEFRNDKGQDLNVYSLQVMKDENILELVKHFEVLTEQDKQSFVTLWEVLLTDKSVIHLFDKEGNCISGDESFFDQYLLNRCSDQNKHSSLVVAYTLIDICYKWGFGAIGDVYLYRRLNILGKEGKVKINDRHEDSERGQRLFNVRIT